MRISSIFLTPTPVATPVRFNQLILSERGKTNKPDRCNRSILSEGEKSNKPDRCNHSILSEGKKSNACYHLAQAGREIVRN